MLLFAGIYPREDLQEGQVLISLLKKSTKGQKAINLEGLTNINKIKSQLAGHAVLYIEGIENGLPWFQAFDIVLHPIEKEFAIIRSFGLWKNIIGDMGSSIDSSHRLYERNEGDYLEDHTYYREAFATNSKEALEEKGFIYSGNQKENYNYWVCTEEEHKTILDSILADFNKQYANLHAPSSERFLKFNNLGNNEYLGDIGAHNCLSWCEEKLSLIDKNKGKLTIDLNIPSKELQPNPYATSALTATGGGLLGAFTIGTGYALGAAAEYTGASLILGAAAEYTGAGLALGLAVEYTGMAGLVALTGPAGIVIGGGIIAGGAIGFFSDRIRKSRGNSGSISASISGTQEVAPESGPSRG